MLEAAQPTGRQKRNGSWRRWWFVVVVVVVVVVFFGGPPNKSCAVSKSGDWVTHWSCVREPCHAWSASLWDACGRVL